MRTFQCPDCFADVIMALGPTGRWMRVEPKTHPKGHLALEFTSLRTAPRVRHTHQGGRYREHVCRPQPRAA